MATRSSSRGSTSTRSLSRQLSSLSAKASGVASQAKAQGRDTTGITNAINRSDAMVAQTNRQGSRSFAGSSEEKAYSANVITPSAMAPVAPIKIAPAVTQNVPNYTANNAGLTGPDSGITSTPNGMLTVNPATDTSSTNQDNNFASYLKSLQETSAPTGESIRAKLEKETGLRQKQQEVNNYSSQLNTITANRDANILKVEGQGRGITDVIIGGQQSQINKEAAIQALPVQAQLAAAQGNLQLANDHINTWGQIMMTDATNQYNRKNAIITATFNYATDKEKTRLTDLKAVNERKYQEGQALTSAKAKAMAQALSQPGGGSVLAAIKGATTLDEVIAATGRFNGDVLGQQLQQAQIASANRANRPQAPSAVKRDTQVVDGKLVDMQTGEVISQFGAKALAVTAQSKQSITDVDNLLKNKTGMATAVGTNYLTRSNGGGFWSTLAKAATLVGFGSATKQAYSSISGKEQAFIGSVEQMRQQLTLDNLVRAKQNGATFGALSDGERQMLSSSATKIGTWAVKDKSGNITGYNIDEKTFTKEVQAINNFAKIDFLNRGGEPTEIGAVANPDGTVWVKNNDGTFSQLK